MNQNCTEIVFVLDRSGSMSGLESDTIGGFNGMLMKQKELDDPAYVTTVLFDNKTEILHDHLDINCVEKLTEDDYYARGCTALLDAVGMTIKKIEKIVKHTKTEKVIFVIITDGHENASYEFDKRQIKNMINSKQEAGWQFIFLGANIDAFDAAEGIGIARSRTANYYNDSKGVQNNYDHISMMVKAVRKADCMADACESINCEVNSMEEEFEKGK